MLTILESHLTQLITKSGNLAYSRWLVTSEYGRVSVFLPKRLLGSNNTDFIGITDEAISSAASGSVIVQGGVITNTGLIPAYPQVVGTGAVFESASTQLYIHGNIRLY